MRFRWPIGKFEPESGNAAEIPEMTERQKLRNIILLGVAFLLVFTAFQTMGNIQQTIVQSIREEYSNQNITDFVGANGYISQALVYGFFSLFNWIGPSVVSVIGPKYSMLLGSIPYALFVGCFLIPYTWLLYASSGFLGLGAAIIWTGHGNYLTLNSDEDTMTRNSGIFWALMQSSFLIGNVFVFLVFAGQETISYDTRMLTVGVLLGVGVAGTLFILFLGPVRDRPVAGEERTGPMKALKSSFQMFFTTKMFLLSFTFAYIGIELAFLLGVYSTCIGNTLAFGESAKQLVGMSGIFIGVGEIVGGLMFTILGKKTSKWGQDPIVLGGLMVHIVGFFLVFLSIPSVANSGPTSEHAFITPNAVLAMFCSFLIGFGDSCYNTQVFSLLGTMYSNNSAPAFMLFKFVSSVASAISFVYTPYTSVHTQLLIIAIFGFLGTLTFWIVCWMYRTQKSLTPQKFQTVDQKDSGSLEY